MLIDTNIFLEILLEQKNTDKCKAFLREVFEGKTSAFISSFSIDTIALILTRSKVEPEKIKFFLSSLLSYKGLKIYYVRVNDRINCIDLMKNYNLDYEDALILQCCISTKSNRLVSFDKHFDKVKEIKRISL
jgi:predicted nucleic acid-binding protein